MRSLRDFYNSPAWLRVRYVALKRARGVCECCGARPSHGEPLHVVTRVMRENGE